jgi:hypothetical protein
MKKTKVCISDIEIMLIYIKFKFLTKYHSFILNCWRIQIVLIVSQVKKHSRAHALFNYLDNYLHAETIIMQPTSRITLRAEPDFPLRRK